MLVAFACGLAAVILWKSLEGLIGVFGIDKSLKLFLSDYLHPRHVVVTNGGRLSIIPNYFNRTPIHLAHRTAICHAAFPAHASANIEYS
jgi:hypothetical protein